MAGLSARSDLDFILFRFAEIKTSILFWQNLGKFILTLH
mgnify:CR=1 FL=1|jgi:hypothetical protein